MWIILIIFLIIISLIITKNINYKNYKLNLKNLKKDKTSLFLTLATKVGVGSIIGTISSILIGGFSSVIWIIIFSFLTSSLIYKESYLGYKNRIKINNEYFGGLNFTNNKVISIIGTILLIILYSFLFQIIQINTITNIIKLNINISNTLILLIITLILTISINLSIKDILNILNKIVPYMLIIFIVFSLYLIIINHDLLLSSISKLTINYKSLFSGMIIGFKRGLFMNETLIGTTAIGSSVEKNDIEVCTNNQVLASYFISTLFSMLIASLLLIYKENNILVNDYNLLINNMFNYFSNIGSFILMLIVILFGITTILSGYYIGKNNINYFINNKKIIIIYNILFIILTTSGIFININKIWSLTDTLMFVIIIINSYSIIKSLGSDKNDRK